MSLLGASLLGQKKHAEAEPYLIQGYKGLMTWETDSLLAHKKNRQVEALEQIVLLYQDWNMPEKAAEWEKLKRADKEEPRVPEQPVRVSRSGTAGLGARPT